MNDIDRRSFLKVSTGVASAFALSAEGADLFAHFAADESPLPAAVIGAGRQGRVILGELSKFPFVTVKALCDVSQGRLRSARRRAPGAETYTDFAELLGKEKEIKAVFISTPSHLHRDIAVACLAAGKHVYCEAPMATTIADCRAIAQAAKKASTVFHVGLQYRSNPVYKLARSFMISGAIRDPVTLRGQFHNKTSWRMPAPTPEKDRALNWKLFKETSIGLAGEEGMHQFDIMSWFLSNKLPLSVAGTGSVMFYNDGREIPDTIHCSLTWPEGLKMSYEATLANSYGGRFEEFMGTMGAIRMIGDFGWLFKEADAPTQGWEVYAIRQHFHKEEGITLIADATKLAKQGKLKEGVGLPHPPMYYGIADFLTSVTGGKPSACPAPLGLRAAVVGIKANEAVMTGKEIVFDEEWFKVG
jgi:predicted dehydrogenase